MSKIAWIFPGQGAQEIGMAKDFYEKYKVSKRIFEISSNVTGIDITKLCFNENDDINITEYTQICMLTTELAIVEAMKAQGLSANVVAGLSLGEYAAAVLSGAISLEDAFTVVRKRGIYMQEAYPVGGGMTAIIGLESSVVERCTQETDGIVSVANYNYPGQTVISGEKVAVDLVVEKCKKAGSKRTIPLNVSGPFHSVLLENASKKLADDLANIEIKKILVPYISNVTADYVEEENIKDLLTRQIISPVRWYQSVQRMLDDGVDLFVEIGPGKTLSGFMRKINKDVKVYNIDTVSKLEEFIKLGV